MTLSTPPQLQKRSEPHVQAAHVDVDALLVAALLVQADLVQQVEVGARVLDVLAEVVDGPRACVLQVVVDPAEQQLLGRHGHQVLQTLAVQQEANQSCRQVAGLILELIFLSFFFTS